MNDAADIIETPLSAAQLAARYRSLCEDGRYANLPGKLEMSRWGQMVMTPAAAYHGALQARLIQRLAALGGAAIAEAPVATEAGLFVPDIGWIQSPNVIRELPQMSSPLERAPDLCIEVVSPSNSRPELDEKRRAYLAAGAREVWLVFPVAKRIDCFDSRGLLEKSSFAVDVLGLFD